VNPFLFITDLDYTLVGDDKAMAKLNEKLQQHRLTYGTKIVYSTGRSITSYNQLKASKPLLDPDILVCSVGTEIYHQGNLTPDNVWSEKLSPGWDRNLVLEISQAFTDLKIQPNSELREFKISYFLTQEAAVRVLPELESQLQAQGLDIQVIYSGGKDLDILPRNANKGMAMNFVRELLNIDVAQTVASGDSGNDIALFEDRQEKGIIVGNARPELLKWHQQNPNPNRYLAKSEFAAGVEEGLVFFGFIGAI
jgi:sucrose-6-phosphatase